MRTSHLALGIAAAFALVSSPISAEVILGPYPGGFGSSVAIEGEWVAVGAPGDSKVYLFRNEAGAWNLKQIAGAIVSQAGDEFGASLAMKNGWLFVGAPARDNDANVDSGSVYTFRLSNGVWTTSVKLNATDQQPNARFGESVAATATELLVGAPAHDGYAGAAYVFKPDVTWWWLPHVKLTAPAPAVGQKFGQVVSIGGEWAFIGAPGTSVYGAVQVFRREAGNVWSHKQTLAGSSSGFGLSVAVSGELAAVGAPLDNTPLDHAMIYRLISESWTPAGPMLPYDLDAWCKDSDPVLGIILASYGACAGSPYFSPIGDLDKSGCVGFSDLALWLAVTREVYYPGNQCPSPPAEAGRSVATDGQVLLMGAPNERTLGTTVHGGKNSTIRAGTLRVFSGAGFKETNLIASSDGLHGDRFGSALALDKGRGCVGAPIANKAYIYDVDAPPPTKMVHSFKEIENTLIPNAKTIDLRVAIGATPTLWNGWLATSLYAATDGTFYQHPVGGHQAPNPLFFSTWPELEFDTFMTTPQSFPNVPTQGSTGGFAVSPPYSPSVFAADYFMWANGTTGDATLARLTVIGGTKLTVTGQSADMLLGRYVNFDLAFKLGCTADINGDGKVGQEDLGILLASYGSCIGQPGYNPAADFDKSGCIDQPDLGLILSEYNCGY